MILKSRGDNKIKIYALGTLCATVLASVLRTFCLAFFYDSLGKDVGYYTKDVLPFVFYTVCFLAVIFFVSVVFTLKKNESCYDGKENNACLKVVSGAVSVIFAVFFVLSLITAEPSTTGLAFELIFKISLLMSVVYFAMNAFGAESNKTLQTIFGFGVVIWAICVLATTYFDIFVPLNSPDKIILHLALLSLMVFFVSEFRCFLAEIKKTLYVFSLCFAVYFSGVASVPSLIKWIALGMSDYNYLYYDIVIFGLFVYVTVRLISFAFSSEKREVSVPVSETESDV